jgi:hypothetical protein
MNTQKPFCATAIDPDTGIGISENFKTLKESVEWLVSLWNLSEYDNYSVERTSFDSAGHPEKIECIYCNSAIRKARDVVFYG